MDVPKRIVDDPSADSVARALIEDARVETAGPGGKARTLAALGLAGGAGLASTSAPACSSWAASWAWVHG